MPASADEAPAEEVAKKDESVEEVSAEEALAEKVETREKADLCMELGFQMFQGNS